MAKRDRIPGIVPWAGGKGKFLNRIIPYIPYTKIYCEPYGGAGSVLMNLEPRPVEVYNDVDHRLINLFQVLQDPEAFERLCHRLYFTPYSRDEFRKALTIIHDPDADREDLAWAFFAGMSQGFGGWIPQNQGSWGRSFGSTRGMASTTSRWLSRLEYLPVWRDRMMRVQIDCMEAMKVIKFWDTPDTTFYVDPPYILETRRYSDEGGHSYIREPTLDYHIELVELLLSCKGAVLLSCHDHEIYETLVEAGWDKISWNTAASAAGRKRGSIYYGAGAALKHGPRTETLYRNPQAVKLLEETDES